MLERRRISGSFFGRPNPYIARPHLSTSWSYRLRITTYHQGMRIHIANFAISFTGPSASPGHKILEKKKDRRAGPSWVSSSCSALGRAPGGSPARGPPGRPADASLGGPACGPAPACRSPCSPCFLPCCHSHASLLLTKIAITATIMPTTMSSGTKVIMLLMASWFSMP